MRQDHSQGPPRPEQRPGGGSMQRDRRAAPVWWRPALAAATVVIVLEGVVLVWLLARQGSLEPFTGASAGIVLEVTFAPESTEAAMREAIRSVNGRIVDGPSPIGVYIVQVPVPQGDRTQTEAAIDRLGARTGIVMHVTRD